MDHPTAIPGLSADDLTPGTIHNYARRVGLSYLDAERRLRAEFDRRATDATASVATIAAEALRRRNPNDRPLADWILVDVQHNRHCWQHHTGDGRIETVCGGSSSGWLVEIRQPDGSCVTTGPIAGGVALAMQAAAAHH